MLSLESSRWSALEHAYGQASDIPPLLRQLQDSRLKSLNGSTTVDS